MPGILEVSVMPKSSYVVMNLAGESDFANGRQLRDSLVSQLSRGVCRIIVDVSGLRFIDSTGLRVLLAVNAALRARDGSLVLVSPGRLVATVLRASGAGGVLAVYGSVAEAVAGG